MKRIAFFGGTFDPPHRGHLAIAKTAADRFALDEILFAPVASQPLKDYPATPFLHRYAMTVLATQTDPRFIPSLLDAPSETPNYTVDTLTRLRSSFQQETTLYTLIGADSWLQISRWHQAARLLSLTDWIVAARPGFALTEANLPSEITAEQQPASLLLHHPNARPTQIFFLPEMQEDISATELRHALQTNPPDPTLLPTAVRNYIQKTNIYSPAS